MERGSGINRVKRYPLSDSDIRQILGDDIKITTYPELGEMNSVEDMFDNKGRAILFFPNASPTQGHWTALINHPKYIEFFDSYGEKPDDQKGGMSAHRLEALDIDRPYLTKLLKASGKPVYYNTKDYQQNKQSVATCGRHAIGRLLYANQPIEDYDTVVTDSGLKPDDFVSGLTYKALKK